MVLVIRYKELRQHFDAVKNPLGPFSNRWRTFSSIRFTVATVIPRTLVVRGQHVAEDLADLCLSARLTDNEVVVIYGDTTALPSSHNDGRW